MLFCSELCVCVWGCFRDHSSVTQRAVHVQDRKHKEMVWSWLITQKPVSTGGYAPGIINPIILRVVKWFGFSLCWDLIWFNSKGLWKWNPHRYLFQLLFNKKTTCFSVVFSSFCYQNEMDHDRASHQCDVWPGGMWRAALFLLLLVQWYSCHDSRQKEKKLKKSMAVF